MEVLMGQYHISKEDKIRAQAVRADLENFKAKLPSNLLELVKAVLEDISSDTDVIVDPRTAQEYITPNQAAIMLNASRPWIRKLMKEGKLRSHQVGAHFRVNTQDVLALKKMWDQSKTAEGKKLNMAIDSFIEETGWDD